MTDSTNLPTGNGGSATSRHVGDLLLRRLRAGELAGAQKADAAAHVAGCADCGRRLDGLAAEQRAFEEAISFDRFAAGVERATRVPHPTAKRRAWARPTSMRSFFIATGVGALASAFALALGLRPLIDSGGLRPLIGGDHVINRVKGSTRASVTIRIGAGDTGPQRNAQLGALEPLASGERLRIGVEPGRHRYVFAISLDDKGDVTPIYPEAGTSLFVPQRPGIQYLPDSIELTGTGTERVVVLLTDDPLEIDGIRRAAAAAFAKAGGKLDAMPDLTVAVPSEQFHGMFLKP